MSLDGQQVGIKTSVIEEKCQAFETLVIYCSTLGAKFAPYLSQSLELVLPSLRFYFHEGVREACALYGRSCHFMDPIITFPPFFHRVLPMLMACGKQSSTLTSEMFSAVFAQLISVTSAETDSSFLASLFKCFADCVRVTGGPEALLPEFHEGIMNATQHQLQTLAEKRKARALRYPSLPQAGCGSENRDDIEDEKEDMALLEELEDFALDEMAKMLRCFDSSHPLLVAVGSVKDLGIRSYDWDSEEEGSIG